MAEWHNNGERQTWWEELTRREITRRTFLKMMSGLGLVGLSFLSSGCLNPEPKSSSGGHGWLAYQYNVPGAIHPQVRGRVPIDPANPSLVRDDEKCVLCGQCIEACRNVESVFGYYDLPVSDETICIHCGQCSLYCPTGAIAERSYVAQVEAALKDPQKVVVVQTAPATRVALAEEFGLPPGTWFEGQQVAALRKLGFAAVFDTNFTADLTIMEEVTELLTRVKGNGHHGPLPMFTSCSPGWIKFCEYFYPELLPHLSTCKSPQQMFGALVKTYYAREKNIAPEKIVSVSIMPCTAKKFEAARPEMNASSRYWNKPGLRDVDYVLTTRELAYLLKKRGIDPSRLQPEKYDPMMGEYTGGGLIFGATGGVMEAAVRTLYFFATQSSPPAQLLELKPVRGLNGVKEAELNVPGAGQVRVAVVHGMANARTVLEEVKNGRSRWHFIEFMTCPGGCVSGGGQPRSAVPPTDEIRSRRAASLYQVDAKLPRRESHENSEVAALYQKFLGHPMSELAEQLLHTTYTNRSTKLVRRQTALV